MSRMLSSGVISGRKLTLDFATVNFTDTQTAQGDVIPNVTEAVNVEKITNIDDREFNVDTGWWVKQTGWSIENGTAKWRMFEAISTNLFRNSLLKLENWYKITITVVNYVSGRVQILGFDFSNIGVLKYSVTANGTYTFYAKSNYNVSGIRGVGDGEMDISYISIQEVGWSQLNELYDWVYANTSGTVAEKESAANKAAAGWCYYNNDANIGTIYGKLYNWYAAKIIDDALTATGGEWRVPKEIDYNKFISYLGGSGVAGGKMKAMGLDYWDVPNEGATNKSGFTALGAGYRTDAGVFVQHRIEKLLSIINNLGANETSYILLNTNNAVATKITPMPKKYGSSLRLVKNL